MTGPSDDDAPAQEKRAPGRLERLGSAGAAATSLQPERSAVRDALIAVVAIVVVGFLAYALVGQFSNLPDVDWRFSPGWLVLSVVALLAFQALHIEIWRLMLRSLGGSLPAARGRAIWSVTLLARYVPTSALMAVGRIALAEREGVPKRVCLASVVYEFALTVVTAAAISVYLVLSLPAFDDEPTRWLLLAIAVAGLGVLHPRVFHPVADYVFVRLGREPLPVSLPFSRVLAYALLYTLSFVVAGVSVWAMAHALHPVDAADTPVAIASYSLGYVAGVIAFIVPGALGAREAGVAVGLTAVVPAALGVAVAVAVRVAQIGVELLYAAVTPVLARRAEARPGSDGQAPEDRPRDMPQHAHHDA